MKLFRLSLAASLVVASDAARHVRSQFVNIEDEVKEDSQLLEELQEDASFWDRSLQMSLISLPDPTPAPVPDPTPGPTTPPVVPDTPAPTTPAPVPPSPSTVWDIVNAQPDRFSIFIAVSALAGRDAFYQADGEITLFVPTDDAFGTVIPSDLLNKYLDTSVWGTGFISTILSFHDIPGTVLSTDLVNGTVINPLGSGGLLPNSLLLTLPPPLLSAPSLPSPASIVEVDLIASNGVVHVVDQVLTPSFIRVNGAEAAAATGLFDILLELVELTGLTDVFTGPGPYSLFAPPDDVFESYGEDFINDLREDPEGTRIVLLNHVIPDFILPCCDDAAGTYQSAAGFPLEVVSTDTGYTINGIATAAGLSDLLVSNGKVGVVTDLLVPPAGGRK